MNKMPEAMEHYWAMWNELDLDLVRGHLDQAVSDDFLFADPINFHQAVTRSRPTCESSEPTGPPPGSPLPAASTHTTGVTGTSGT